MSRPLLISDCDDVLLHFAPHFAEWVARGARPRSSTSTRRASPARCATRTGEPVARGAGLAAARPCSSTARCTASISSPARSTALRAIGEEADIVILTNIGDQYRANRIAQLEAFDIRHRVLCNQGGKGAAGRRADRGDGAAARRSSSTISPVHHESVAKHAPDVWRLHMIAEPRLAAISPPAPFAHARIDDWDEALPWILAKLA